MFGVRAGAVLGAMVVCAGWLGASDIAQAQNVSKNQSATKQFGDELSFELYGGYLTGESREVVFDNGGRKISELHWKIERAAVIGGIVSVRPLDWLTLKVNGWTNIAASNRMDDYDWLVPPLDQWSDLSRHPDTRMSRSYTIDASFALRVVSLKSTPHFDAATVSVLGGYRWFSMGWTAYGGSFLSSSDPGFRDESGTFANAPVISYRQWMETPFIGLGGTLHKDRWALSAEVIGSVWAKGNDRDDHHLRTIMFEDKFDKMSMIAANLAVSYRLTDLIAVVGRADFQNYFEAKGDTTATNYSSGAVSHGTDVAGMSHYSLLLSLGVKAKLY